MATLKTLRKKPYRFRFTQRRAPALVRTPQGETYRPRMLVLFDESRGQIREVQAVHQAATTGEMREWLQRALLKPSDDPPCLPNTLILEDEVLAQSLRYTFKPLGVEILYSPDSPVLDGLLASLEAESGINLASYHEYLGPELYRELAEAAHQWCENLSPQLLENAELMMVQGPGQDHPYGLLLEGESMQDFSLLFTDSLEQAFQLMGGKLHFRFGFGGGDDSMLRWNDLSFLDHLGLKFPEHSLPLLYGRDGEPEPPSHDDVRLLIWLLRNLREFIESGEASLIDSGFRLMLVEENSERQEIDDLIRSWEIKGRVSQRAQDMALFFVRFFEYLDDLDVSEDDITEHRSNCVHLGKLLLATPRKPFRPAIFLDECKLKEAFQSQVSKQARAWKSLTQTWKALGGFLKDVLASYEPHSQIP